MEYSNLYGRIVKLGADYIRENNLKAMILGLSGGIDSALTAALAYEICKRVSDCSVIGAVIPIESNKDDETERGRAIGGVFCATTYNVFLNDVYSSMVRDFPVDPTLSVSDINKKIRRGNIKARLRMIYLYHLAHLYKGLVLSTDNISELLLGFWTLHGDVGDIGLIQSLWKTEVYELARYIVENKCNDDQALALQSCIDAVPTDGLGVSESDFDQLGCSSYWDIDKILYGYIYSGDPDSVKDIPGYEAVVSRYESTHYKRNNPVNFSREDLLLPGKIS